MNIGFALCGSYCTFSKVFPVMEALAREHRVIPIFSDNVQKTGSRFGEPAQFYEKAFAITGVEPICSVSDAEPIGPKKLFDALVIAPCTGNTLAKLSHSIADTPVTMAAKSHLRNTLNISHSEVLQHNGKDNKIEPAAHRSHHNCRDRLTLYLHSSAQSQRKGCTHREEEEWEDQIYPGNSRY